jgi:hypothetical protein
MASLILLSNLPLTTNPGQESVYQCLLENTFKDWPIKSLSIEDIMASICDVWAAHFRGIPSNQQPHIDATYNKGKALATYKMQQKQQTQVQQNTTIKGKGPNPQYSQQQNAESGNQQQKRKHPFRRGGNKGKNAHSHVAGVSDTFNSNFILTSVVVHITDTPSVGD